MSELMVAMAKMLLLAHLQYWEDLRIYVQRVAMEGPATHREVGLAPRRSVCGVATVRTTSHTELKTQLRVLWA